MCKQNVVHMKILGKTCPLLGYTIMFQNSMSIQTLEGISPPQSEIIVSVYSVVILFSINK
jgi:hypothetical protein